MAVMENKRDHKGQQMPVALGKAAIAGAGLALAFLASIDLTISVIAKESWDAWQVDALINPFAIVGAIAGAGSQLAKATSLRWLRREKSNSRVLSPRTSKLVTQNER